MPQGEGRVPDYDDPMLEQQAEKDTDQDGSGDRKVERDLILFDDDIPREFPDPRDLFSQHQKDTHQNDKDTDEDEELS